MAERPTDRELQEFIGRRGPGGARRGIGRTTSGFGFDPLVGPTFGVGEQEAPRSTAADRISAIKNKPPEKRTLQEQETLMASGDREALREGASFLLREMGVSAEIASQLLADDNAVDAILSPEGRATLGALVGGTQFQVSSYDQALAQAGFGTEAVQRAFGLPGQESVLGGFGTTFTNIAEKVGVDQARLGFVRGFTTNPQTGAVLFATGVIADPTSGTVVYPPGDASIQGSEAWLTKVGKTWNKEQIQKWRRKLAEFGYLADAKGGRFDVELRNALYDYHRYRYLNQGDPIPLSSTPGGATSTFANARVVRGQIAQDVRDQFQRVFGDSPSDAELDEWSEFVIRTANRLQRKKDLAPGSAVAEAQARAAERFERSPQARFELEVAQENTQLHDAIVNAVRTTEALMRS